MKKRLLLALFAGITVTTFAQNTKRKDFPNGQKEAVKPLAGTPLSWGSRALLESEKLNAALFKSLLLKPFTVTSGAGAVDGFSFTYAERAFYEDSLGNPLVVMDYMTEYCFGDTLSKNIKLLLPPRVKAGDTVYIANVKVKSEGAKPVLGRAARIIITP